MILDSRLTIRYDELREYEWRKLFAQLLFFDSDGVEIACWKRGKFSVEIPRGAWNLLPLYVEYEDNRVRPKAPELRLAKLFQLDRQDAGRSFEGQADAVEMMFREQQGIIVRPPGTGKTQIALAFIARCQTTALVLVHTEDILNQWIRYAENTFPELRGRIGVIAGGRHSVGQLTIATVQSIKDEVWDSDFWLQFGAVIVDEGHHAAARTWETILNVCPAFYRFGLTATERRADGMEPLMRLLLGPVIHRQKFQSKVPVRVVPVKTRFYYPYRGPFDWSRLLTALCQDKDRNQQIADVVDRQIEKGHSVLILSRRIGHLTNIREAMAHADRAEVLTGRRSKKDREQVIADFRAGKVVALLATQLADEALDVPRLDRVVLVYPGKHDGRIIQQVGRALREFPDKLDAVVFDVVDDRVSGLRRQWGERRATYKKLGIKLQKERKADAEKKQRRAIRDLKPQRSRRSSRTG